METPTTQYDPALAFTGITRGGQQLYADLQPGYDPAQLSTLKAAALDAALQQGVDLGKIGDNYITGQFQSFDDYLARSPQLLQQLQTYAQDPTKYSLLDQSKIANLSKLPEFSGISPVWGGDGINYGVYDSAALNSALGGYSFIDPTKFGDDILSREIREKAIDLGGQYALDKDFATYYDNLAKALSNSRIGYYGLHDLADPYAASDVTFRNLRSSNPTANLVIDGKNYGYIPYEAAARVFSDSQGGLGAIYDVLGNEYLMKQQVYNLPPEILDAINRAGGFRDFVGTKYAFDNPGLGYLVPDYGGAPADANLFGVYNQIGTGNDIHGVDNWTFSTPYANHNTFSGTWLQRLDPATRANLSSLPDLPQSERDRLAKAEWFSMGPKDFSGDNRSAAWLTLDTNRTDPRLGQSYWWYEQDDGGILGSIAGAIAPILPILNFIPGVNAFTIPLTAGMSLGSGIQTGNLGQIASGALGIAGLAGFNPLSGITNAAGDALSGIPGMEFLSSDFQGPLTSMQAAAQQALKGGAIGGLGSLVTGGDVLSGIGGGALGGGLGSMVGDWNIGGSGSLWDKLSTDTTNQLARDFVLNGGKNAGQILTNAGANVLGNLASGVTYDALKTAPQSLGDGNFRIGDIVYDISGSPQGFFEGDEYKSYADIAAQAGEGYSPGSSGSLADLNAIENSEARKYSQAAGMGVATYLKTGDVETALMAALPYAASGAIDSLFDSMGIDANLDPAAMAKMLTNLGVSSNRAQDLAEAARTARANVLNPSSGGQEPGQPSAETGGGENEPASENGQSAQERQTQQRLWQAAIGSAISQERSNRARAEAQMQQALNEASNRNSQPLSTLSFEEAQAPFDLLKQFKNLQAVTGGLGALGRA